MNERVKKRFEEYAGYYKEAYLSALNTVREKKGERPLDPSEDAVKLVLDVAEMSFIEGAMRSYGYAEFFLGKSWHKVAYGDLPKRFGDYLVIIDSKRFGRRWAIKCWYGYPEDHFSDNTSKGWVLEEDEIVSYWMEIPELPNED